MPLFLRGTAAHQYMWLSKCCMVRKSAIIHSLSGTVLCNVRIVQSQTVAHPSYSSLCLTLSFRRGHDFLKIIYMFYSLLQTFSAYLGNYHLLGPQYVFRNWIVLLQHILNDSICLNGITLLWILLKTWYNAGPMIYNSASHCLFLGYRDFNTNMSPFNILKIF